LFVLHELELQQQQERDEDKEQEKDEHGLAKLFDLFTLLLQLIHDEQKFDAPTHS